MHPLRTYVAELLLIRSTGANTPETSFYGPLATLLNAAGQALKPRVRCVMNLKNQGAGTPDGGLFTPDQFQRGADEPLEGQPPARGVIECKIEGVATMGRYYMAVRLVVVYTPFRRVISAS